MTGEPTDEKQPADTGARGEGRRRRKRRKKPPAPRTAKATAKATGGTASTSADAITAASAATGRKRSPKRPRRKQPVTKKGGRKKPVTKARGPKLPTTREVSAGGVVYRRIEGNAVEVVLASRRTRRGDLAWGLAKGGIEVGESKEAAALREVREETGLVAEIEADLGDTKYMYVWEDVRIRKTVHFFLMRHVGGDIGDRDDEMEEIRWFPLERALKRAAYRGERDVLARAAELLR